MTVPAIPDAPTTVAGDGQVQVSWTIEDATPPVTSYTVNGYDATWSALPPVTVDPPSDSVMVVGLTNGAAYTFTVTATNSDGSSPMSLLSSPVTPIGPPPPLPTCGACKYFNPVAVIEGSPAWGQCRVNPPVPTPWPEWKPSDTTVPVGIPSAWPLIQPSDWCGDFIPG